MLNTLIRYKLFEKKWLPPLVAILLITSVVVLWSILNNQRITTYQEQLKNHVAIDKSLMNSDILTRISVIERMVDRWEKRGGVPKEEFLADAENFLHDYPGFQALEWADPNYIIRWVSPLEGNEAVVNLNLAFEERRRLTLENARLKKTPTISPPIKLVQGGMGFLIYFPMFVDDKFDGFILAVLQFEAWVNHVSHLNEHMHLDEDLHLDHSFDMVHLDIFFDGELVFASTQEKMENSEPWEQEEVINLDDRRIVLRIAPTEHFFHVASNPLPEIAAFGASLLSIFLFSFVILLNKTQKIAREAEAANIAKSSFLSTMSHEIRTPLNGILGITQLLRKTSLDEEQSEQVEIILQSGETLLSILNDVLDMSRIESGQFELEDQSFELASFIQNIAEPFKSLAEEKNIALDIRCDFGKPIYIVGDPVRLRQILWNLISNAIKFTDSGYVRLSVDMEGLNTTSSPPMRRIKFCVSDSGKGIAQERLNSIFTPFTQEDSSITRKYGGTGLGLSIVNKLVNLMGGTIDVNSKEGLGSSFDIYINFKLATEVSIPSEVSLTAANDGDIDLKEGTILIAEDNTINAMIVKSFIRGAGYKSEHCENGLLAVKSVQRNPYALVLMDIHMPEMNGIEATKEIRKQYSKDELPIIALTAEAFQERHLEFLNAGMNDVLTKPVSEAKLVECIHQFLDKTNSTSQPSPTEKTPTELNDHNDQNLRLLAEQIGEKQVLVLLREAESTIEEKSNLLATAVENFDAHEVAEIAHSIKGIALSLHAETLVQTLVKIEHSCEDQSILPNLLQEYNDHKITTLEWWKSKQNGF
ncbi:ATP-binding protein [Curvivirga sp.]|uniref:ATP-binding protein n=1 Tax=Curvivirga sp. TaxID=2856848 RepID=UPI003B58C2CC